MRARRQQQQRQRHSSVIFPFILISIGVLLVILNINVMNKWQVVDRMLHVEQYQFSTLKTNFFLGSTRLNSRSRDSSSGAQLVHTTTRKTQLEHQQQRQLQQQAREQFGGAANSINGDSGELYAVNAFHFGFFDDNKLQRNGWAPPTQEEYQGLLCQTKAFYLNMFQNKLGDSIYVNLYTQNWTYTEDTMFPISHSLVVHATFEDGTPLDPKDINRCIQASDMAFYLKHFVWKSDPFLESVFYDTNQAYSETSLQTTKFAPNSNVNADLDTQQHQTGGIVIGSSLSCPTNGNYEASLHFGYFPGFGRKPSIDEIDNLKPLTEAYLSRVLQFSYDSRQVQVSLDLQGWDFDEATTGKDNMPLTIRYYLTASFVYGGDVIPMEYVKDKLAHSDDVKDSIMRQYIKQAVWEVPPFKQSSFWDVNRVRMHNKIYKMERSLDRHGDNADGHGDLIGTGNGDGTVDGNGNGQGGTAGGGGDSGAGSQPGSSGIDALGGGIPGIGGFGVNAPGSGGDPGRAGSLNFGTGGNGKENGDGSGGNDSTSNDPTRTTLFSLVLQPVTVSPDECRDLLKDANTNLDRFMDTSEFLVFLNAMTNQTYFGFPYIALPDAVQDTFSSLSTKTDDNQDAVDLLGAYNPTISREDLNLLEKTRGEKICRYVKSNLNEAIKNGKVTSDVLVTNVGFFVTHEGDEFGTDPNTTALDLAFINTVSDHISPGMEESMKEGRRRLQGHRVVTERKLALHNLRRLQEDTVCYVLPNSATVSLEEAECRSETKKHTKCFNAVAGFNTFFKGEKASEMAQTMEPRADELAEKAIANGYLSKEVSDMDPLWAIETMFAPTSMPSVAPSLSPSVALPPTVSPTSGPKDMSFGETLTDSGGTGLATAAVGSVILMVALQCGREFLVDLVIRCCKVCCRNYRKAGDIEDDFDPEAGSEEEGEYNDQSYGDESYEDSQHDENYEEATETDVVNRDLEESDEEDEDDSVDDEQEEDDDDDDGDEKEEEEEEEEEGDKDSDDENFNYDDLDNSDDIDVTSKGGEEDEKNNESPGDIGVEKYEADSEFEAEEGVTETQDDPEVDQSGEGSIETTSVQDDNVSAVGNTEGVRINDQTEDPSADTDPAEADSSQNDPLKTKGTVGPDTAEESSNDEGNTIGTDKAREVTRGGDPGADDVIEDGTAGEPNEADVGVSEAEAAKGGEGTVDASAGVGEVQYVDGEGPAELEQTM